MRHGGGHPLHFLLGFVPQPFLPFDALKQFAGGGLGVERFVNARLFQYPSGLQRQLSQSREKFRVRRHHTGDRFVVSLRVNRCRASRKTGVLLLGPGAQLRPKLLVRPGRRAQSGPDANGQRRLHGCQQTQRPPAQRVRHRPGVRVARRLRRHAAFRRLQRQLCRRRAERRLCHKKIQARRKNPPRNAGHFLEINRAAGPARRQQTEALEDFAGRLRQERLGQPRLQLRRVLEQGGEGEMGVKHFYGLVPIERRGTFFRRAEQRVARLGKLLPNLEQIRCSIDKPREAQRQACFTGVGHAEDHCRVPLPGGEVTGPLGGSLMAAHHKRGRRKRESNFRPDFTLARQQRLGQAFLFIRQRRPESLVLQRQPDGGEARQLGKIPVLGFGLFAGGGPQAAREIRQPRALSRIQLPHPLGQQDMIGVPGRIRGDEERHGIIQVRFEHLFE